jgi:hypothetical protein
MNRANVVEKLSVAMVVLLERGPMSISSLAEEVAKIIGSKVTTTRSQLSMVVGELIRYGILMDVGTDRFGSRLIDLSPHTIATLLSKLASGYDCRYFKWGSLVKYFERRLPHMINYVKLLKVVVDEWVRTTLGGVSEEEMEDFTEELAHSLITESKLSKYRAIGENDIPVLIEQIVVSILESCVKHGSCNIDRLLERLEKEGLTDILKEIIHRRATTLKIFETKRPLKVY